MDLILNALFMLVTHTVPEDIVQKLDSRTFKISQVYDKVQFTNIPEGTEIKNRTVTMSAYNEDFEKDLKKNTGEIALIRLRIPVHEKTIS